MWQNMLDIPVPDCWCVQPLKEKQEVIYCDTFPFMFSHCCHWGAICLVKFWFPFHGVKAWCHFQPESTVSSHWSSRFIEVHSDEPLTGWHLEFIILSLPLINQKMLLSHRFGRFNPFLWRTLSPKQPARCTISERGKNEIFSLKKMKPAMFVR